MTIDDAPDRDPFASWWENQHDALALALGKFAIEFAQLEDALNRTIHELLGLTSDTGHALTSAVMNFTTRLDILRSLTSQLRLFDGHQKIIEEAIDDATEINTRRNWFLHDAWSGMLLQPGGKPPQFEKRRMRPKGGARSWQTEAFSAAQVDDVRKRCTRAILALEPVIDTMRNERLMQDIIQRPL